MEFHEFAAVFPLMEGEELERLAHDIRTAGKCHEPITLYEGKVLDGRNRSTACVMASVVPVYREFTGTREEALAFVWSENEPRRHMDSSQRAACAYLNEKLRGEIREAAERRRCEGQKTGGKKAGRGRPIASPKDLGKPNHDGETDEVLAKASGTNRQYVADVRNIAAESPDDFDAIHRGRKKIPEVKRKAKEDKRELRRQENAEKAATAVALEDVVGKFAAIVIDPPWDWGDEGDVNQMGRKRLIDTDPAPRREKSPLPRFVIVSQDVMCCEYVVGVAGSEDAARKAVTFLRKSGRVASAFQRVDLSGPALALFSVEDSDEETES